MFYLLVNLNDKPAFTEHVLYFSIVLYTLSTLGNVDNMVLSMKKKKKINHPGSQVFLKGKDSNSGL